MNCPEPLSGTTPDRSRKVIDRRARMDSTETFKGSLCIDYTHVGRHKTGIERITQELFDPQALADIPTRYFRSPSGRPFVLIAQMLALPLNAILHPKDVFVFPGFAPSPLFNFARERCVLYVHDLFLLTRRQDLNFAGKFYFAFSFGFAISRFKYFFVNSEGTGNALRAYCRTDAQIMPYRPRIRNVFGLSADERLDQPVEPAVLRLVAVGTVEPRKNYLAAADIRDSLARRLGKPVELHIIGRQGWSGDWGRLTSRPGVVLHGAISDQEARAILQDADIFVCSSHDEGLGLPLLEVQHGGLPTVAPDDKVFREVLGASGVFIKPEAPEGAAALIMQACSGEDWRRRHAAAATANLERWDNLAAGDHRRALSFLKGMLAC